MIGSGGCIPLSKSEIVMAETKLSVGQALDKLRGTDAPKAKLTRLDEKIDDLDKEAQRLRAMRRSLGPRQKAEPNKPG
jgi:hypothetical protein